MRRFVGDGSTIVRIGNRMFKYIESLELISGSYPGLSALGFETKTGAIFNKKIEKDQIDSAYSVMDIVGLYLNKYKAYIFGYNEETKEVLIRLSDRDGKATGMKPKIDRYERNNIYYEAYVPESDLSEIYEIREPEGDFPFESPRIVYHRKDGVWLPWHELGAPLKDDEWL